MMDTKKIWKYSTKALKARQEILSSIIGTDEEYLVEEELAAIDHELDLRKLDEDDRICAQAQYSDRWYR